MPTYKETLRSAGDELADLKVQDGKADPLDVLVADGVLLASQAALIRRLAACGDDLWSHPQLRSVREHSRVFIEGAIAGLPDNDRTTKEN